MRVFSQYNLKSRMSIALLMCNYLHLFLTICSAFVISVVISLIALIVTTLFYTFTGSFTFLLALWHLRTI